LQYDPAVTRALTVALLAKGGTHPTRISILAMGKISRRGRNRLDRSHAPTM
jgi:hypothetical protein